VSAESGEICTGGARLPSGRHGADPDGGSGKRKATRVEHDVNVLAQTQSAIGLDAAGHQMLEKREDCKENVMFDGALEARVQEGLES